MTKRPTFSINLLHSFLIKFFFYRDNLKLLYIICHIHAHEDIQIKNVLLFLR